MACLNFLREVPAALFVGYLVGMAVVWFAGRATFRAAREEWQEDAARLRKLEAAARDLLDSLSELAALAYGIGPERKRLAEALGRLDPEILRAIQDAQDGDEALEGAALGAQIALLNLMAECNLHPDHHAMIQAEIVAKRIAKALGVKA